MSQDIAQDLCLIKDVCTIVITQHFVMVDERSKTRTGRNDKKCQICHNGWNCSLLKRRLRHAPIGFEANLMEKLEKYVDTLRRDPQQYEVCKYDEDLRTILTREAASQVHKWINNATYLVTVRVRR